MSGCSLTVVNRKQETEQFTNFFGRDAAQWLFPCYSPRGRLVLYRTIPCAVRLDKQWFGFTTNAPYSSSLQYNSTSPD